MSKINTKIGDIFSIKLDNGKQKYFQLIVYDLLQLNSDVIRVFKKEFNEGDHPSLLEIVSDEIDFYAHCVIKFGLKMNIWEKIGSTENVGDLNKIIFRGTEDSGSKPGEQVLISDRWYVWKINDKDYTRVGVLRGEYRKAEIGIVVNPYDIVDRIKTGRYSFFYPDFK